MTGGGAALRRRQRLMDRNGQGCRIWKALPLFPTFAVTVTGLLVASAADAAAQWDQPVSVCAAVQFGGFSLFGVLHTRASHLREGIHVRNGVREGCEVPHRRWAALIEHLR